MSWIVKRNRTERMVLIALFSTLTWIGAYLRIDFLPPVPFTLQTLMVIMAGLILGARYAALSQGIYVLLGLIGVPVFTQGGGPGYLLRPGFGFILGFVLAAALVGWLGSKFVKLSFFNSFLLSLVGMVAIYLMGIPYIYLINILVLKNPVPILKILLGMLPFMVGDVIKSLIVAGVAPVIVERVSKI